MPYPTPPGKRLAYDIDGTAVLISRYDGSVNLVDAHPTAVAAMNAERGPYAGLSSFSEEAWPKSAPEHGRRLIFILPVATRIDGFYFACNTTANFGFGSDTSYGYNVGMRVETSVDSTNGLDGTWVNIGEDVHCSGPGTPTVIPEIEAEPFGKYDMFDGVYRTAPSQRAALWATNDRYRRLHAVSGEGIRAVAGAGTRNVRAVRFTPVSGWNNGDARPAFSFRVHLYGEPDTAASDARLTLWRHDQAVPVPAGWFDWGDTPLGSSADKRFRVHNDSTVLTANEIVVDAVPANAVPTPGVDSMLTFSTDDGVTWLPTVTIAALSPGATSGEIRVRRVTPSTAELSNWAARITAEAGSWT